MSVNALLQGGIVAVLVLWAALQLFGRLAPRTKTRLQRAIVDRLEQTGRPQWLRSFAARMRPPANAASGCGSGCSSCDSCGAKPQASTTLEQPLQFVPPRRPR